MADEVQEPKSLEPTNAPKETKSKKKLVAILLVVLLLAALGASGYLYWQFKDNKQQLSQKEAEKTALEKKLAECKKLAKESGLTIDTGGDDLPVVIFSPGGLFTEAEKTEITNKMIAPYKAWHRDQGDSLVSIHVQQHFATPGQYVVNVIYQNEVYEGFLYGTIDAATQAWWFPECLDACEFSDTFRAAYPEVVEAAGG